MLSAAPPARRSTNTCTAAKQSLLGESHIFYWNTTVPRGTKLTQTCTPILLESRGTATAAHLKRLRDDGTMILYCCTGKVWLITEDTMHTRIRPLGLVLCSPAVCFRVGEAPVRLESNSPVLDKAKSTRTHLMRDSIEYRRRPDRWTKHDMTPFQGLQVAGCSREDARWRINNYSAVLLYSTIVTTGTANNNGVHTTLCSVVCTKSAHRNNSTSMSCSLCYGYRLYLLL